MNQRINIAELLEDLGAKTSEVDAFLNTEIADQFTKLTLVFVFTKEGGPYENRHLFTIGKSFRKRL